MSNKFHDPNDGAFVNMLNQLKVRVQGFDPITNQRIGWQEQQAAIEMYEKLQREQLEREKMTQDRELAEGAAGREDRRLLLEAETRQAELQIEHERLTIQKAEVIVKALEVGVKGGVPAEKLLLAIQGLSEGLTGQALLPDREADKVPRALANKDEDV